jgi:hypothetical protein
MGAASPFYCALTTPACCKPYHLPLEANSYGTREISKQTPRIPPRHTPLPFNRLVETTPTSHVLLVIQARAITKTTDTKWH